jgi:hypothetical protein
MDAQLATTTKTAAVYLMIAGITSMALLFRRQTAEFLAQSAARRAGHYTREVMLDLAFVISGVAVLGHREWGRYSAVVLLVIGTFYSAFAFARGFAGGTPAPKVLVPAFIVVGAWNALWVYLPFRSAS